VKRVEDWSCPSSSNLPYNANQSQQPTPRVVGTAPDKQISLLVERAVAAAASGTESAAGVGEGVAGPGSGFVSADRCDLNGELIGGATAVTSDLCQTVYLLTTVAIICALLLLMLITGLLSYYRARYS